MLSPTIAVLPLPDLTDAIAAPTIAVMIERQPQTIDVPYSTPLQFTFRWPDDEEQLLSEPPRHYIYSECDVCCMLPGIAVCCASDLKAGTANPASTLTFRYNPNNGTLTHGKFGRKLRCDNKANQNHLDANDGDMWPGGRVSTMCCWVVGLEDACPRDPASTWDLRDDGTIALRGSDGKLVIGVGRAANEEILTLVFAGAKTEIKFTGVIEAAAVNPPV